MRSLIASVSLFALSSVVGCSVETVTSETSPREDRAAQRIPTDENPAPPAKETNGAKVTGENAAADAPGAEVVYVLMRDDLGQRWFCTGTLVAKDRVVTAAHCLESDKFVSWEIVAPLAPGKPRVSATSMALRSCASRWFENDRTWMVTLNSRSSSFVSSAVRVTRMVLSFERSTPG